MENKGQHKADLSEVNQTTNDVIKSIINKRAHIQEKFNKVNEKLDKLKAEADKLLHPEKS
ncbi:hypothetical protein [Pedobacter nyackensis]|uniref:Uncharacterized protein n=1 Tax=Pedobacter nyackensis TaxID=475255 RepID=A0A1W2EWY9_9SPHI|nr:hypothetical protein [Pedobacter nyackensis]SMD14214.1 hypothetical protein SAMN04488101_11743 [Pedobacter nyackensis]